MRDAHLNERLVELLVPLPHDRTVHSIQSVLNSTTATRVPHVRGTHQLLANDVHVMAQVVVYLGRLIRADIEGNFVGIVIEVDCLSNYVLEAIISRFSMGLNSGEVQEDLRDNAVDEIRQVQLHSSRA